MNWYKHILRLITLAFMLVLTGAAASAQSVTVYAGDPFTFIVEDVPGDSYSWEVYEDYAGVNLVAVPGNSSTTYFPSGNTGPSVDIVFPTPGLYLVKVYAVNQCPTDNIEVYLVEVLEALPTATILPPGEICEGDELVLEIEFTGTAPWEFDLFDGVNTVTYTADVSPYMTVVLPSPTTTTTYTVTRVMDTNGTNTTPSNSVTVTVNPQPVFNSPIYSVP